MIVLDGHCDSPSQMYRLRDFGIDNIRGQVDFPKMKRGGVDASFFAAYISAAKGPDEALPYARALMDTVERQVSENSDSAAIARTRAEIEMNKSKGLTSIVLCMENGSPIQHDLGLLREFYDRGVRYMTLTHSADNQICDSCSGKGTWGGLSPFGREVVREMNRLGMIIDVAHCSDATVRDVLELSTAPIADTHCCCRAVSNHRRNLPDDLLRAISERGGVIGMSMYPLFLSEKYRNALDETKIEDKLWIEDEFIADPGDRMKFERWWKLQDEFNTLPRPTVGEYIDMVEYAISVCGADHVGIGTDYDGIETTTLGLETIESFSLVFDEMRARGFDERTIEKVAGENFLSLLERVCESKA